MQKECQELDDRFVKELFQLSYNLRQPHEGGQKVLPVSAKVSANKSPSNF